MQIEESDKEMKSAENIQPLLHMPSVTANRIQELQKMEDFASVL